MVLLGLAWAPVIAQAQEFKPPSNLTSPAMIAEGRAFYNRSCAGQCHGVDGQEGFEGPSLVGKTYLDPTFVYVTLITGRPSRAISRYCGYFSRSAVNARPCSGPRSSTAAVP